MAQFYYSWWFSYLFLRRNFSHQLLCILFVEVFILLNSFIFSILIFLLLMHLLDILELIIYSLKRLWIALIIQLILDILLNSIYCWLIILLFVAYFLFLVWWYRYFFLGNSVWLRFFLKLWIRVTKYLWNYFLNNWQCFLFHAPLHIRLYIL